jgi:hypothetical protein
MMAEVENLVLDHLRHMRGQLDRMEHKLEDVIARLSHGECSVAPIGLARGDHIKFDRLNARVARIEKQLDRIEG